MTSPHRKRRLLRFCVAVVLAIALAGVSWWQWSSRFPPEPESTPAVDAMGPSPTERAAAAERGEALRHVYAMNGLVTSGDGPGEDLILKVDLSMTLGKRVTDKDLGRLAALTDLRELDLSNAHVTGTGLSKLSQCVELRRLSLRNTNLTDAGLSNVATFPQLEELAINQTDVGDAGLTALGQMPKTVQRIGVRASLR